jgi:hypothetical protein
MPKPATPPKAHLQPVIDPVQDRSEQSDLPTISKFQTPKVISNVGCEGGTGPCQDDLGGDYTEGGCNCNRICYDNGEAVCHVSVSTNGCQVGTAGLTTCSSCSNQCWRNPEGPLSNNMSQTSVRALFLLMSLIALPAIAYRREYAVTWEGQRKQGSEVCFYRGAHGDAFSLYFESAKVQCLPAESVLDFPPGLIHAFARHKDGYASAQRDFTVDDGPPKPEQGYQRLETPLAKAGVVDFAHVIKTLGQNQHLGVWVVSTSTSSGTFIPLVSGETTILAPVEIPIVPLLIENGLPVRVGEPLSLQWRERQTAVFPVTTAKSDVILWTRLDADSLTTVRSVPPPPAIALKSGDRIFRPVAPLYAAETHTLLIFRGVPYGRAAVTAQGTMWKPFSRSLAVGPLPVTAEREAVPLIAGGSVMVRWSPDHARQEADECHGPLTRNLPLLQAELRRCQRDVQGEVQGVAKCTTIAKATATYGSTTSVSFDGIPSGTYTAVLQPPLGKRVTVPVEVVGGRQTVSDVTLPSFSFFGSVKVGSKVVRSRLMFATGQAVSDLDGRYTATLAGDPLANQISIEPCDSQKTLTFIPASGPAPNAAFDIDLALSSLDVQVEDPELHPVAGAWVWFAPIKQVTAGGAEVYFHSLEKQTDAKGHASFDDVPDGFPVSICARHTDTPRSCSSNLSVCAAAWRATPGPALSPW